MSSGNRPPMREQLDALISCVLAEVPRPPAETEVSGSGRDRRLAALVSAYHASAGPVVMCWHRASANGPVRVHVAGDGLMPPGFGPGDSAVLGLPAGARGEVTSPGVLSEVLAGVPFWAPIRAVSDPLVADEPAPSTAEDSARPTLEDCLLGVWHGPFSWLVVAEPVSGAELDEQIAEVGNEQRRAAVRGESSPDYAVQARRAELRHRELTRSAAGGLWRLRYAAGGATPEAALRIAGLVCASADTADLPYLLTPTRRTGDLDAALAAPPPDDTADDEDASISSAMLAAVLTPPAIEIPGVRFRLTPEFDVTPEVDPASAVAGSAGSAPVWLGTVLDRNRRPAGDLVLPRASLNRHTFVCGATGGGKSQTIRGLLETAAAQGLPWLVVEPAKAEYRLMASRLAGTDHRVIAIRPGDPDQLPAGLNPLEPGVDADGHRYPLQTHLDLVRALFLAAFEADEPFPQVLSVALTRCYEQLGWDLALGEPARSSVEPRYPTIGDLQRTAMEVVEDIGYGREITDNVRGFISVRLSSLRLGTTGRFFEGGHPLDLDALLRSNVVFEIEDVGDDRDKAFLMGTVLIRLVEHLRLQQKHQQRTSVGLQHLSVFEEAHRLLRNATEGPAAHAVEMFAGLLAEIRAYGEGLIIAEQIPSKLLPDVIKNTAIKVVHRLPAKDDRDAVGATMNITDAQSDYLVTLTPGQAAVFTDGMDYPLLTAMPDGSGREDATVQPSTGAELVRPRSNTCGSDCSRMPCTLRQIRTAQRTLLDEPQLVLWAELAVVAHLTGWSTPMPGVSMLGLLRDMDRRTRDCALSHAVDHAVAARSRVVAQRFGHDELAEHIIATLRETAATGVMHLADEPQWLAPAYRWSLVHDDLERAGRDQPDAGRHPDSDSWEATYGQLIPGSSNLEQLTTVFEWLKHDQRDPEVLRIIALGDDAEPPIIAALGTQPDHPDWIPRFADLLGQFAGCRWPLHFYAPGEKADTMDNGSAGGGMG